MEVPTPNKAMLAIFLGILLVGPILNIYFISMVSFIIFSMIFGFFEMLVDKRPTIILCMLLVMGTLAVGIHLIEFGHAAVASVQPDLSVSGISVSMFEWSENRTTMDIGMTLISYNENLLTDPETSGGVINQLNWAILGGGTAIALMTILYWLVPLKLGYSVWSVFPPATWTIMLFYHNFPAFIWNDTTMAIEKGWMSPLMGWASFLILFVPIILVALVPYLKKRGESVA